MYAYNCLLRVPVKAAYIMFCTIRVTSGVAKAMKDSGICIHTIQNQTCANALVDFIGTHTYEIFQ